MIQLYDILLRRIWLLAAAALLGAAAGATIGWLMVPIYRAEVVVAPRGMSDGLSSSRSETALGGLAALAGLPLGGASKIEEHFAYLQSRGLKLRFIEAEALVNVLSDGAAHRREDGVAVATPQDALRILDSRVLAISREKLSGMVRVTVDWPDPALAAAWASAFISQANRELAEQDALDIDRQIEYVRKQLATTEQLELRESLYRIMEGQLKSRMLVQLSDGYAFKVIDNAFVPDANKPIRPRKLAMIAAGSLAGVLLAVVCLTVVASLRARKSSR